jgi:hypothetical protein
VDFTATGNSDIPGPDRSVRAIYVDDGHGDSWVLEPWLTSIDAHDGQGKAPIVANVEAQTGVGSCACCSVGSIEIEAQFGSNQSGRRTKHDGNDDEDQDARQGPGPSKWSGARHQKVNGVNVERRRRIRYLRPCHVCHTVP